MRLLIALVGVAFAVAGLFIAVRGRRGVRHPERFERHGNDPAFVARTIGVLMALSGGAIVVLAASLHSVAGH